MRDLQTDIEWCGHLQREETEETIEAVSRHELWRLFAGVSPGFLQSLPFTHKQRNRRGLVQQAEAGRNLLIPLWRLRVFLFTAHQHWLSFSFVSVVFQPSSTCTPLAVNPPEDLLLCTHIAHSGLIWSFYSGSDRRNSGECPEPLKAVITWDRTLPANFMPH